MDDIPNFWDKTHRLSAQADQLFEELVPPVGMCNTVQGELLRASSKIGYDWYNNGWGCNNWSGAVRFLQEYTDTMPVQGTSQQIKEFYSALRQVYEYSHGEPVDIGDSTADRLVTTIHEYVVTCVLANSTMIENTVDMWDLQELDFLPEEDDDQYEYFDDDEEEDDFNEDEDQGNH